MFPINKNMRSESSMKAIWNMVLELDPSQRSLVNVLGIEDSKLTDMLARNVEHDQYIAIIIISLIDGGPAKTRDKNRLTHNAVRIPNLASLTLQVMLHVHRKNDTKVKLV